MDDKILRETKMVIRPYIPHHINLNADTQVFYELNIYGEDMYQLLAELHNRFGTDFSDFKISDYAPGEGFNPIIWLQLWVGMKPFRRLTVRMLSDAIKRGRW